jgi:hypothetical protein
MVLREALGDVSNLTSNDNIVGSRQIREEGT